MKEKLFKILIIIIIILLLIAGYLMYKVYTIHNEPVVIKTDTVTVVITQEPIVIDTAKAKLVYRTKLVKDIDTFIIKQDCEDIRFTASLDTIANADTISLSYFYPENFFNINIKQKPDTARTITVFKDKILKKEQSMWETGIYVLGGFLLGYLIAK
jgi:hypothetical protein